MKTLTVNGVRLAVMDRGDGLPLVFVHGFPLDHTIWDAQVEALAGRYRVIAPDLRGFGQSGVTEGSVSMEQLADDLAELLDALGTGRWVILCGLSMGGYVAWEFWRKYAERLRAWILCDTRSGADTPEAAAGRLEIAQRVLREGPAVLADTILPKLLAPQTLAQRPQIADRLRKIILASDPRGLAAALRGMAERPDSTAILPYIDCPTLVLAGQEDTLSPVEQMRAMAQRIPRSQFVTIAAAGHLPPVEQPAATTAAIEAFLSTAV